MFVGLCDPRHVAALSDRGTTVDSRQIIVPWFVPHGVLAGQQTFASVGGLYIKRGSSGLGHWALPVFNLRDGVASSQDSYTCLTSRPHKMVVLQVMAAVITGAGRRILREGANPWQGLVWTFEPEPGVPQQEAFHEDEGKYAICGAAMISNCVLKLMGASGADFAHFGTPDSLAQVRRNIFHFVVGLQDVNNLMRATGRLELEVGRALDHYDPASDINWKTHIMPDKHHPDWHQFPRGDGQGLILSTWVMGGDILGRVVGDTLDRASFEQRMESPPAGWSRGYAIELCNDDTSAALIARERVRTQGLGYSERPYLADARFGYLMPGDQVRLDSESLGRVFLATVLSKRWTGYAWGLSLALDDDPVRISSL